MDAQAEKEREMTDGTALPMTWTNDELDRVGKAEELEITSLRRDGTPRKPVTIWVVRFGDDLYVRSAYGQSPAWFRGTQLHREGKIGAGGVDRDVNFVPADPALNDQIDGAFRTKYHRHGARYVDMVVTPEARSTTIRLVPRSAGA
jgi:hypothetical protein